MSDISGIGPISPKDRKMYEQEYKQSADLFQRALDRYSKSDNLFQQGEFKDVMDQAMNVLNEAAHQLMRQDLLKQNEKIAQDYVTFQKFPEDPDTQQKLNADLDSAKKNI